MTSYPSPPPPYQPDPTMRGYAPPPAGSTGPRKYGMLSALVLAPIFHQGLYRDVARNWRGIGALYLLLLIAITALATSIRAHYGFKAFVRDDLPGVIENVPPISIRDGVVSSPVEQPYYIKDKDTGKVFAIIDTTGAITSLQGQQAMMLLTQNELHRRDRNRIEVQDLSQIKSFDIDRQKLQGWMDTFSGWLGPAAFVFLLVAVFVYRLIQALLYALMGLAFSAMFNARLRYQQLLRLSIVSITGVKLLSTALELAGVSIPLWWPICFVLAMVYLAMAVRANAVDAASPPGGFEIYAPPAPYPPEQGRPIGM